MSDETEKQAHRFVNSLGDYDLYCGDIKVCFIPRMVARNQLIKCPLCGKPANYEFAKHEHAETENLKTQYLNATRMYSEECKRATSLEVTIGNQRKELERLNARVKELKEYEYMYKELCK